MKVYLPNDSNRGAIGGGWTFSRNLAKASKSQPFEIVDDCATADIALVCGATMVGRDTFQALRELPCKVILRCDGIPEDHRNRGTGWPRLRDFGAWADAVVYQSAFTKSTVGRLLGRDGRVIVNGCDTSIFTPDGDRLPRFGSPSILHVCYRKDPNKRIDEVIERFRYYKLDNPGATLTFAGIVPTYLREWGFGMLDYKRDRDWRYLGIVDAPELMATVMRSHDALAFPSFADPCPNTLIEALCCGVQPIWTCEYGGVAEIIGKDVLHYDWSLERMGCEYTELFDEVVS